MRKILCCLTALMCVIMAVASTATAHTTSQEGILGEEYISGA